MITTPEQVHQMLLSETSAVRRQIYLSGTLDHCSYLVFYGIARLDGQLYRLAIGGNPADPDQVADAARQMGQRKLLMASIFAVDLIEVEVPEGNLRASLGLAHGERRCVLVSGGFVNTDADLSGFINALFPVNLRDDRYLPGQVRLMRANQDFLDQNYNAAFHFVAHYLDYVEIHSIFPTPMWT